MACTSGRVQSPHLAGNGVVTNAGDIMMSGDAVNALGLPTSVAEQHKCVCQADADPEKDLQMYLVPKEILNKFLPSVSAIQAQTDGETQQGRNQQDAGTSSIPLMSDSDLSRTAILDMPGYSSHLGKFNTTGL